jgi:hypothetical protein
MISFSSLRTVQVSHVQATDSERELLRLAVCNFSFILNKQSQYSFGEFANEIAKSYDAVGNPCTREMVENLRNIHS